jgi:hypothetical protein
MVRKTMVQKGILRFPGSLVFMPVKDTSPRINSMFAINQDRARELRDQGQGQQVQIIEW